MDWAANNETVSLGCAVSWSCGACGIDTSNEVCSTSVANYLYYYLYY